MHRTLLASVFCASLLAASPAWAGYGASASAVLVVGPLTKNTFGIEEYPLTATVSGGCTSGNNPSYSPYIHGTRRTPWLGGFVAATQALTFTETHTESEEPGAVVWSEVEVGCGDQAGIESTSAKSENKVLPPRATQPLLMTQTPPDFYQCFPVGVEVQVAPMYTNYINTDALIAPVETMDVVIKGAGIDFKQTFASAEELDKTAIKVKATSAGPVELWVVKQPYGAKSNVVALEAKASGCQTTPGGDDAGSTQADASTSGSVSGAGGTDAGKAATPAATSSGGCSSATASASVAPVSCLAVVAGLFAVLRFRRRGA